MVAPLVVVDEDALLVHQPKNRRQRLRLLNNIFDKKSVGKSTKTTTRNQTQSLPYRTRGKTVCYSYLQISTLASVTDEKGNVLCWSSTGESGFTGSRKSTPYAATITENAVNKAASLAMNAMSVFIKGQDLVRCSSACFACTTYQNYIIGRFNSSSTMELDLVKQSIINND